VGFGKLIENLAIRPGWERQPKNYEVRSMTCARARRDIYVGVRI
jgi:hypothetical protein